MTRRFVLSLGLVLLLSTVVATAGLIRDSCDPAGNGLAVFTTSNPALWMLVQYTEADATPGFSPGDIVNTIAYVPAGQWFMVV